MPTSPDTNTRCSHPRPAPRRCSPSAPRSASLPTRTLSTGRPSASASNLPRSTPLHPRLGARCTNPSALRVRPGHRHAHARDPRDRPGPGRARRRARRPAARCPAAPVWPLGSSTRSCSRTWPPRPMAAAATDSTPSSTARATAPDARTCTIGEGRPGPELSDIPSSTTNPRPASSWTRSATVERFSPVAAPSWDRDADPSRWRHSNSALKLWRRTTEARAPVRGDRGAVASGPGRCGAGRSMATILPSRPRGSSRLPGRDLFSADTGR